MKKKAGVARTPSSLPLAMLLSVALAGCVSNQNKPVDETPSPQVEQKAPEPAVESPVESKPVCKEAPAKAGSKATKKGKTAKGKTDKGNAADVPADCVPASEAKPAAPAGAAAVPPRAPSAGGYDLSKNKPVTDSTKVEAGQGTLVKGINDWQGEIAGVPAASSRFTKLKIGMPQKQVTDLIGEPTDQGAYVTGKAFIPFYFGSDKSRWEMVYKGQGRLIFSNQAGFGSGFYLTWIIHNANEPGYR